ncbi:hypothetical protein BT67DRAFT_271968 [Trichocladium antarcticum]|uniref:Uncharacterized protein n=1 Tax=Trichocladium antarcticum TaxID=1450529 RepID=A0AAN6UML2_9PEZI|nr:hypothetical protein BT67DRAFT_271968 [Trichocladium antarcticum]
MMSTTQLILFRGTGFQEPKERYQPSLPGWQLAATTQADTNPRISPRPAQREATTSLTSDLTFSLF